ncbi:SpoIIIAH-like family protein [Viridibacillus sp. FSL E2-0187]|uniref:SpoIIIAH-like family protein n=1 Tax=Viridibacillus TaxID=496496 RepID=UPI00187B24E6|nr:SpoIIIAH-like family protein [Viridibacillus sp. JNUCC-6]QOV12645.1 SpoIIIAH-like family protein [Viridibacillus sp. JNUCC-6]
MRVKKRAVWFLTLLSLAAVISVYYLMNPAQPFNGLKIFSDSTLNGTAVDDIAKLTGNDKTPVTAQSDLFEEMRMELLNERSQLKATLTQKIASEKYTAEEKNEAFNDMDVIVKKESNEAMLELLIKTLGYSDAFVRAEDDQIRVTVQSAELSKSKADEIVYTVKKEVPTAGKIVVDFKSESF